MDFERCRLNMFVVGLCALSILLTTVHADMPAKENHDELTDRNDSAEETHDSIERRQDNGGFDFMRYFVGNNQQQAQQQVQQANHGQQQLRQAQPVATQQLASQQQLSQQQQLQQQLQQLQLLQALQQQQAARSSEVYQEPSITPQHQPQQQAVVNRDGGYGSVGIGGGYEKPKQIGISIGGNRRPGLQIGSILTLLPRIFNILSAGGKVMFGLELGNNFYFGPVGAKPLYG